MVVFVGLSCSAARRPADQSDHESSRSALSDHGWCAKAEEHINLIGCLTGLGDGEWTDVCCESIAQHGVRQRLKAKCMASVSECAEIEDKCDVDTGNQLAGGRRKTKATRVDGGRRNDAVPRVANSGDRPREAVLQQILDQTGESDELFAECVLGQDDPSKAVGQCLSRFPGRDPSFVRCVSNPRDVFENGDLAWWTCQQKEILAFTAQGNPLEEFNTCGNRCEDNGNVDFSMEKCVNMKSISTYANCVIADRCRYRAEYEQSYPQPFRANQSPFALAKRQMNKLQCTTCQSGRAYLGRASAWACNGRWDDGIQDDEDDFVCKWVQSKAKCLSGISKCSEIKSKCKVPL